MIRLPFFTLIFSIVCVNFITAQDFNQTDEQGKRHGPWKKFYPGSQQLRYKGTFDHGQEVGTFSFYSLESKNQAVATKTYTPGSTLIDVTYFTNEGNIISKGQMEGRQKVGRWTYYHPDGKTIMTLEQYKAGVLEGQRKVFFPNSQLAQRQRYKNGKEEGLDEHFAENGTRLKIFNFKQGRLEGPSKIWNVDGELLVEGQYKDNKKHGIWKYYKNGKLGREVRFPQNKIGVNH
ncbi:MAG: hypothetical protein ABNH00_08280 [Dokdonia sp.]|jgi:antitoxin component YwqK of YwqJK toxin-antitoxin module